MSKIKIFSKNRIDHLAKALFYILLSVSVAIGIYITLFMAMPIIRSISDGDTVNNVSADKNGDCVLNIIEGEAFSYGKCLDKQKEK